MSFTVDTREFGAAIAKLAALNNKSQGENLLSFARTTLRNSQGTGIIDQTPPASPGVTGAAARRQGEAAIDRDVRRVFFGVKLKHKRPEKHTSPGAIHRRLFAHKKLRRPLKSDLPKGIPYYVSEVKLKELIKRLKSKVGRMAASWTVSARRLGVPVPPWIGRHGTEPGDCRINLRAPIYEIEMTARPNARTPVNELENRVSNALRFTRERLLRAIAGTRLANDAKKAGFKVI